MNRFTCEIYKGQGRILRWWSGKDIEMRYLIVTFGSEFNRHPPQVCRGERNISSRATILDPGLPLSAVNAGPGSRQRRHVLLHVFNKVATRCLATLTLRAQQPARSAYLEARPLDFSVGERQLNQGQPHDQQRHLQLHCRDASKTTRCGGK